MVASEAAGRRWRFPPCGCVGVSACGGLQAACGSAAAVCPRRCSYALGRRYSHSAPSSARTGGLRGVVAVMTIVALQDLQQRLKNLLDAFATEIAVRNDCGPARPVQNRVAGQIVEDGECQVQTVGESGDLSFEDFDLVVGWSLGQRRFPLRAKEPARSLPVAGFVPCRRRSRLRHGVRPSRQTPATATVGLPHALVEQLDVAGRRVWKKKGTPCVPGSRDLGYTVAFGRSLLTVTVRHLKRYTLLVLLGKLPQNKAIGLVQRRPVWVRSEPSSSGRRAARSLPRDRRLASPSTTRRRIPAIRSAAWMAGEVTESA